MNNRNHKIIAVIISIVLGIVILGTSVFIAESSDHDCIGQGCTVCTSAEQCEEILHALGLAVFGTAAVFFVKSVFLREITAKSKSVSRLSTLITLKVELLS